MQLRRVILVLAASVTLVGVAVAQAPLGKPLGFLVRFGIFRPSSGAATALGEQWFTAGVEFSLFKARLPGTSTQGEFTLSGDAFTKSGATAVPVLLNYVGYSNSFRYSIGAGAAFLNRDLFESSTRFAMQFSAGYLWTKGPIPILLEVRYYSIFETERFFDGFGITIGLKL